jgi:hypothetical protein
MLTLAFFQRLNPTNCIDPSNMEMDNIDTYMETVCSNSVPKSRVAPDIRSLPPVECNRSSSKSLQAIYLRPNRKHILWLAPKIMLRKVRSQ